MLGSSLEGTVQEAGFSGQGHRFDMAIRVRSRSNESVNQMLRRFKKLCEKEGLTKDIKKRQYFEKPSERRRRAKRKSVARAVRPGPSAGGPARRSR